VNKNRKLPLLIKDNDYHRLQSLRGVIKIKQAKKDVRWALETIKIGEIFMFYH
jgi:hypothetical protein